MNINANRQRFQLFIIELVDYQVKARMPMAAQSGCLDAALRGDLSGLKQLDSQLLQAAVFGV